MENMPGPPDGISKAADGKNYWVAIYSDVGCGGGSSSTVDKAADTSSSMHSSVQASCLEPAACCYMQQFHMCRGTVEPSLWAGSGHHVSMYCCISHPKLYRSATAPVTCSPGTFFPFCRLSHCCRSLALSPFRTAAWCVWCWLGYPGSCASLGSQSPSGDWCSRSAPRAK